MASDLPVIRESVASHGVGFTAPHADVDAIAEQLRRVVQPAEQERLRARISAAAAELTWEREQRVLAAVDRQLVPSSAAESANSERTKPGTK